MDAEHVLKLVAEQAHQLVERQYHVLNDVLLPALKDQGVHFLLRSSWNDAQRAWIRDFFFSEVMPVLTPIGLDPAHPFPRVLNKSLNFAVELQGKDAFGRNTARAIVQAPRVLHALFRCLLKLALASMALCFFPRYFTPMWASCLAAWKSSAAISSA